MIKTITMKKTYFYKMKGYISSYTLFILSIYLIIISTYSAQYSIKLKTIHNIQIYYDSIISDKLKRGD